MWEVLLLDLFFSISCVSDEILQLLKCMTDATTLMPRIFQLLIFAAPFHDVESVRHGKCKVLERLERNWIHTKPFVFKTSGVC